jgi:hypothetical protein
MVRVDDWKNHRVEQFGRLLLHGVYTVVTGRTEQEKDVRMEPVSQKSSSSDWLTYSFLVRDLSVRVHPAMLQGSAADQEQGEEGQDQVQRAQESEQE